jgi:hypothetical protein
MKEAELLIAVENFRESTPVLYGVIICIIFSLPLIYIACSLSYLYGMRKTKRNEEVKSAVDLIGKTVTFQKDSLSFEGMVVSVDFDLDDCDNLIPTVYIEVDGLENYYQVNYKEFGKTFFEKGGAE